MKRTILVFSLLFISLLNSLTALAQSYTDKVRQFERLLREWKSDGYSTGSEKYTQLMSMVTEGCRMSERIAKAYIDDKNASTFDIKAPAWFQYIKENKISISLRDLREKTDDERKTIVYCWITYTQPGRPDLEDFVGFKFDGAKIFYICNDDMERANRRRADNECSANEQETIAIQNQQWLGQRIKGFVLSFVDGIKQLLDSKVSDTQKDKLVSNAERIFAFRSGSKVYKDSKEYLIRDYLMSVIQESKNFTTIEMDPIDYEDLDISELKKIDDSTFIGSVKFDVNLHCKQVFTNIERSYYDYTVKDFKQGYEIIVYMRVIKTDYGTEYLCELGDVTLRF